MKKAIKITSIILIIYFLICYGALVKDFGFSIKLPKPKGITPAVLVDSSTFEVFKLIYLLYIVGLSILISYMKKGKHWGLYSILLYGIIIYNYIMIFTHQNGNELFKSVYIFNENTGLAYIDALDTLKLILVIPYYLLYVGMVIVWIDNLRISLKTEDHVKVKIAPILISVALAMYAVIGFSIMLF